MTNAEKADLIDQVADAIERITNRPAYIQWLFPDEWHKSRSAPARAALALFIRRCGAKRPWMHLERLPQGNAVRLVRDCARELRGQQ